MTFDDAAGALLSICLTCRDGREDALGGVRAGARLAQAVVGRVGGNRPPGIRLRGVRCMSQCKRPCVATLTAPDRFAYVFGDPVPDARDHVDALLALPAAYLAAPEGFLERAERPEPLRARILGRLPPPGTTSDLVVPLSPDIV